MTEPNNDDQSPNSTNKDTASEEALAARFAADKERFKMTEQQKEEVLRIFKRLLVYEGKMTQEECDEIERQIAAEESQKPDVKMSEREEGQ